MSDGWGRELPGVAEANVSSEDVSGGGGGGVVVDEVI